jgi:hypothetical protein
MNMDSYLTFGVVPWDGKDYKKLAKGFALEILKRARNS